MRIPKRMVKCEDSSSVDSFGYNEKTKEFYILFKSGGDFYVFFDVPQKHFIRMINAESRGKYFHKFIKEKYSSDIIE